MKSSKFGCRLRLRFQHATEPKHRITDVYTYYRPVYRVGVVVAVTPHSSPSNERAQPQPTSSTSQAHSTAANPPARSHAHQTSHSKVQTLNLTLEGGGGGVAVSRCQARSGARERATGHSGVRSGRSTAARGINGRERRSPGDLPIAHRPPRQLQRRQQQSCPPT